MLDDAFSFDVDDGGDGSDLGDDNSTVESESEEQPTDAE